MTATKKTLPFPKTAPKKKPAKDACPGGGKHKFVGTGDDRACEKCHEPAPKKPSAKPKPAKVDAGEKKLSAINAAAQVLAKSKEPMTTVEMIEQMAGQGLWTSPGGKTPAATLYSAILRDIATKGKESRFVKTERGKFAANR